MALDKTLVIGKEISQILYEDEDILVCVKPRGIAAETRRIGQQDMVSLLRNYRSRKLESAYIGLVHRLDQPVEGIMVFGKNPKSTAGLSAQLRKGVFSKKYMAVVSGKMPQKKGHLLDYIVKDSKHNLSRIAGSDDAHAKKAELDYEIVNELTEEDAGFQLVCITLLTGRHHQIRLQLSNAGAPIVGDVKYGSPNRPESVDKLDGGALALCAYQLQFFHPITKKRMEYQIHPSGLAFQKFGA